MRFVPQVLVMLHICMQLNKFFLSRLYSVLTEFNHTRTHASQERFKNGPILAETTVKILIFFSLDVNDLFPKRTTIKSHFHVEIGLFLVR